MKKFLGSAALLFISAVLLCSCASSDTYRAAVYTQPKTEAASSEDFLEEIYAAASEDAPAETSDTAEGAASEAPLTEEPLSEEPLSEESSETEEFYEIPEGLDTFYISEYDAYKLTAKERAFTKDSIFIGDSICLGFSEYKTVLSENVFARGSLAARNFFEFNLYYGDDEVDYLTVLERTQPKYVFLSMGMNDINLTDEETYCENYRGIIDTTLENSDAVVYVCAITPINCEFSTNYRIDCFNLKMEQFIEDNYSERVYYVDFAKHLKDSEDNLKDCFNGGDGIHLAPYAYYVALWEMNRTMIADGVK